MIHRMPVMLAAACLAAMCATLVYANAGELEAAARQKALDQLMSEVREIKISEDLTVGKMLDDIKADVSWEALLGGAEELRPARHYGNGETEVELRISSEKLRANIAALIEKHMPESELKLPDPEEGAVDEYIVVKGFERRIPSTQLPVAGPPAGLLGWDKVTAQDRARMEREDSRILRDGLTKMLREEILPANMESGPAADLAGRIAALINPESKAYLSGGILETNLVVTSDSLQKALRRADAKFTHDEIEKILEALKATDFLSFNMRHIRAVDGRKLSEDEAEGLHKYVTLKSEQFPRRITRSAPPAGEAMIGPRPELVLPE